MFGCLVIQCGRQPDMEDCRGEEASSDESGEETQQCHPQEHKEDSDYSQRGRNPRSKVSGWVVLSLGEEFHYDSNDASHTNCYSASLSKLVL